MKKTAIVTGAMGGIGFATVAKLRAEGYRVVGLDLVPEDRAAERYRAFGDGARYVRGDLTRKEDRANAFAEAKGFFGELGALVNVAGVAPTVRADLLEMTEESYDRVMGINAKGTMFMTQAAAKIMMKNAPDETGLRGFIVNISSMSAYTSSISRGEYCISKAGVSMITKLFADRLAPEGILVNEVRPGIVATGMTAAVKGKYDRLIFEQGLLPIKRWGQPEDIAKAVYVLCSGQLGYTTGQSLDVDGGFHIQRL